jgi:hypothetical protein
MPNRTHDVSRVAGVLARRMKCPGLAFAWVSLLSALAQAQVQVPPTIGEPQPGRIFCDQSVAYRIADPATVPERYRGFLGAWSDAAWNANTCAALIVESIDPDGTASVIYAYGPLGSSTRVAGGKLHGTGIIRDSELRFQNTDGTQFAFRPGIADLIGRMTTPNGQSYEAAFKKTF